MSMPQETTVTCRECQATQAFVIWQSLNVTLNPDEKQRLLKGELTRFTCAKCGWSGPVDYPLLYHDMEKHFMLWLGLGEGEPDMNAGPPLALMKDYCLRFVATQNELVEKILIFDAALDDRVVEFLKFVICVQAAEESRPLDGEFLFGGLGNDPQGSGLIAFEHLRSGKNESFVFPRELYDQFAVSLAPKLSGGAVTSNWLRVDRDFAKGLVS